MSLRVRSPQHPTEQAVTRPWHFGRIMTLNRCTGLWGQRGKSPLRGTTVASWTDKPGRQGEQPLTEAERALGIPGMIRDRPRSFW